MTPTRERRECGDGGQGQGPQPPAAPVFGRAHQFMQQH